MDELELYQKASALEQKKADSKEFIRNKRVQAQTEMAGMADVAMSALYSLLTHEDPNVRIKALSLWANKMMPTIAPERAEDEKDVIDAGMGFEDIAAQIDALKRKAAE